MQTNEENVRLERVLVVFYLIFTGLGLICEKLYLYRFFMMTSSITIDGFQMNILSSLFSVILPVGMYIGRDKLKRGLVWMIWLCFLIIGCLDAVGRLKQMDTYRNWCAEVGCTVSDIYYFYWCVAFAISLLILFAELLTITKYRSKPVLIVQLIIFVALFIYRSLGVYGGVMPRLRYEQSPDYYFIWKEYCVFISAFFYVFWMYVKKDPKPKKEEPLVFADGQWKCGACGEVIKENNVFCAMCGRKVR